MKTHTAAYTLIELIIVTVIATILLTSASMTYNTFLIKNRVYSACNKIITALQLARNEAIARGENVIFCKSNDHKTCGGTWSDGQILKTKDKLIRVFDFPLSDILIWKSSFGKNDDITFTPIGATNGQQGSFYYCPKNYKAHALAIIVEQTGRIRLSMQTADGHPFPCP